jgi:hypothetical protein
VTTHYKCKELNRYNCMIVSSRTGIYELRHNKTNIVRLRPAWIQTSLRFCAVWSGSILFAINLSTCYRVCKRTAWILIGWSGSMLVANPLCWFCRDAAHITTQMLWCSLANISKIIQVKKATHCFKISFLSSIYKHIL